MKKIKRQRPKLGAILAIPLPNNTYAFGRLFKEYTLAIYKERKNIMYEIPKESDYDFFVTVYRSVICDGEWPVVGNIPFENEDDAWKPPNYMKDIFTGKFSIYEHGIISPSKEDDCKGLEICAVWEREHVIDRLMGKNVWTQIL